MSKSSGLPTCLRSTAAFRDFIVLWFACFVKPLLAARATLPLHLPFGSQKWVSGDLADDDP